MPDENERPGLIDIVGEAVTESLPQHLQCRETATVSWIIRVALGFYVGRLLLAPFFPSKRTTNERSRLLGRCRRGLGLLRHSTDRVPQLGLGNLGR